MKKTTFVMAALFAAAGLFGRELSVNGSFRKLNRDKTAPNGWNTDAKPEPGAAQQLLPGRKARTNAFQLRTKGKPVGYYTGPHNVKAGETVEFSAEVKGRGKAYIQLNLFGERGGGFVKSERLRTVTATDEWTSVKGTYTVAAEHNGKAVKTVRFLFGAEPDSDIMFENLKAAASGDEEDDD